MKKLSVGALVLFVLTLSACGSSEPVSRPTSDQPVAELSTIPTMTDEQATDLRSSMGEINPALDHDGVVDDARNTCQGILDETDESILLRNTTLRFTAPELPEVSEEEATQILDVVRENGFCVQE